MPTHLLKASRKATGETGGKFMFAKLQPFSGVSVNDGIVVFYGIYKNNGGSHILIIPGTHTRPYQFEYIPLLSRKNYTRELAN
jgi:hypothetical protein